MNVILEETKKVIDAIVVKPESVYIIEFQMNVIAGNIGELVGNICDFVTDTEILFTDKEQRQIVTAIKKDVSRILGV